MRQIIGASFLAISALLAEAGAAVAQADTNVLRVARGVTSRDVGVFVNRAVVLESAQRFAEVSVANPAIADVAALSDQTIYILGKATGTTTLTLLGEGGRLITNVDVRVTPDLSEFKQRLREVLPREEIEVREANGGVILSGVVSGARKIDTAMGLAERYAGDNVTNLMSVGGTQQVMLKIRFAEMSRSTSKSLGLNFGALYNSTRINPRTGLPETAVAGQTNQFNDPGNTPGGAFTDVTGAYGIARLFTSIGGVLIDVVLNALEQQGVVRTLAEPNLVALSGDTAEFLAGGEVPIPVSDEDGITVEFKPFGVGLSFTPTVVDEDLINLELETEVSQIDNGIGIIAEGIVINGFTTRRARTTVELRDGQSLAIAGLIQEDFTDGKTQVPFLGDLPVLGTLFRSSEFQRNQSELVIIVTPQLVIPVDGDQLSLPTDRMKIPNEYELFLLGQLEGDTVDGQVASQGLDGSYGYILE